MKSSRARRRAAAFPHGFLPSGVLLAFNGNESIAVNFPSPIDVPHAMRPRIFLNLAVTVAIMGCAAAATLPEPQPAPTGITLTPVIIDAGGRMMPAAAVVPAKSVRAERVLAEAEGEATYYASKFDGRQAASGIVFRNSEPYAAHRTYPFGTIVRVTNLANERSVIVRVIDRGPHGTSERAKRTIIDVSQSAAQDLDFIRAGRIPVRVEVLEWGG
jgi:rare lipoprotein A